MSRACRSAPAPTRMGRRVTAAASLAVLLTVGLAIMGHRPAAQAVSDVMGEASGPAQAAAPGAGAPAMAPVAAAKTTVPGSGGPLTLSVTPASGLAAGGAQITVRGSGFDSKSALWVAVCQDDGVAPQSLSHCLGGAIPDSNASSAWGVVNQDGEASRPGPAVAAWQGGGSFRIDLYLPGAAGQDADCLAGDCSVYVRSADSSDRGQDAQIPVRFARPRAPTTAAPATQTIGALVTTATPETITTTLIAVGEKQTVVFAGFNPGEAVDVTLYSDPIPLPAAQADGNGLVTIVFTVPKDLPFGLHLIQAIGRESGRIGLAQFAVGAPATTTSSSSSTATGTTMTQSTSSLDPDSDTETILTPGASDQGEAGAGVTPGTQAAPAGGQGSAGLAATETAASSTSTTAGAQQGSGTGISRLAWLLIALVALAVLAAIAGAVVMVRRRRADVQ